MTESKNKISTKRNKTSLYLVVGCVILFLCLVCLGGLAAGGYYGWRFYNETQFADFPVTLETAVLPTPITTPVDIPLTPPSETPVETPLPTTDLIPTLTPAPRLDIAPPDEVEQSPIPPRGFADLETLLNTNYPAQDYYETAVRLGRYELSSRTVNSPRYELNDIQSFVTDDGEITAVLMGITDHLYFWVDDRLDYRQADIQAAAIRTEEEFYPQLINLFGQEWQPGIDGDPHFSILHLSGGANGSELGFFSDTDEYPRELYNESNEEEVVYLIMGPLVQGEDLYYGTLVHEIQHLIQWNMDRNESTWLNEGLSQLAENYVELDTADTYDYLQQPTIRLNSWAYEDELIDAHYAGAYLYSVYLYEQLGENAIKELSRHPANGMAGVHAILRGHDAQRSLTQFTADWAAANYLNDPDAGPRYRYRSLTFGKPALERRIEEPDFDDVFNLDQFGVHYIELDYRGPATVTFAGDTVQNLIDSPPRSGEQMWFAPPQNDSDLRLTAAFDLNELEQATLRFSAWYDLEEEYDFAYVSISTDGGETWELLPLTRSSVGEFGPAFNGRSADRSDSRDGWIKESISLNRYAGQIVLVRFDVLTDSAVLGKGFALDDLSVPELLYASDVENGPDGWEADGFVQTGWQLPQQWAVQLIEDGPNPTVSSLPLNDFNQGQWPLTIGKGGGVLVITPLTPFIVDPAAYWLQIVE